MKDSFSGRSAKSDFVFVSLVVLFILVVGTLIYFNSGSRVTETNGESGTIESEEKSSKHVPLNLSEDDILVSFRIDDITFETKQKQVLENALYLARKYNITFDLAVIAEPFDKRADPEVFKIYEDNQDVFEVVAHGWDHKNYLNLPNSTAQSEFGEVNPKIQEDHIKRMKQVFEKHNFPLATKILILPFNTGDTNTIEIAERYGYTLMSQWQIPNRNVPHEYTFGDITVSNVLVGAKYDDEISDQDIKAFTEKIKDCINGNQKRIQLYFHEVNFYKVENSDQLIKETVNMQKSNSRIKFDFISRRFAS